MNIFTKFKVLITITLLQVTDVRTRCLNLSHTETTFAETTPPGTVLFESPDVVDTGYTFHFPAQNGYGDGYFNQYFTFKKYGDTWQFKVAKPVDLDIIQRGDESGLELNCSIMCTEEIENEASLILTGEVTFLRRIHVTIVDEYPIQFEKLIFYIPEDAEVNKSVGNLSDIVSDKDFPDVGQTRKYQFKLSLYEGKLFDGSAHFQVTKKGELILIQSLDFEKGHRTFGVTVIENSIPNMPGKANLELWVVNVNDNPPIFYNTGLLDDKKTQYYATRIHRYFKGYISGYFYGPIDARDDDNETVVYYFSEASHEQYKDLINIDSTNGGLFIVEPIVTSEEKIDFTVIAKSIGNLTEPAKGPMVTEAEIRLIIYTKEEDGLLDFSWNGTEVPVVVLTILLFALLINFTTTFL